MTLTKWIHHLFNPHCPECAIERDEELARIEHDESCPSCELLRQLLTEERTENSRLLSLALKEEPVQVKTEEKEYQPLTNKNMPWRVRQQMLEAESREKARVLKDFSTESLESELGINLSDAKNS